MIRKEKKPLAKVFLKVIFIYGGNAPSLITRWEIWNVRWSVHTGLEFVRADLNPQTSFLPSPSRLLLLLVLLIWAKVENNCYSSWQLQCCMVCWRRGCHKRCFFPVIVPLIPWAGNLSKCRLSAECLHDRLSDRSKCDVARHSPSTDVDNDSSTHEDSSSSCQVPSRVIDVWWSFSRQCCLKKAGFFYSNFHKGQRCMEVSFYS